MALFSGYLSNYGLVSGSGKTHRHLLDKITLTVQAETPFMDSISRAKMDTPRIEWLEEVLSTGNRTDKVSYGTTFEDLNANHRSAPTITQRSGQAEQFAKGIEVTDEQETAKKAGVKSSSEMSENLYTKMIEIKTDVEATLLSAQTGSAGTGDTDSVNSAAQLTGAFSQIAAGLTAYNSSTAGQVGGTAPAFADTNIRANTFYNTLTGAAARDAVRVADRLTVELYQSGALSWKGGNGYVKDASMILMSPNNKYDWDRSLDARPNVRRDIGASGSMLGMMFDMYKSSYGEFKVMPDRFILGGTPDSARTAATAVAATDESRVLVFNPQNWALAVNKDFYVKDIATIGLTERKMVSARFGLIHRSQEASGQVRHINAYIG